MEHINLTVGQVLVVLDLDENKISSSKLRKFLEDVDYSIGNRFSYKEQEFDVVFREGRLEVSLPNNV